MPVARHVAAFEERAEILATMDLGTMWDRYLGEFLAQWDRLDRQGLSGEAMEREMMAFLEDLSEKPLEDLARQTSGVAYNQGRDAEILSAAQSGQVEFVVRSEVLDNRTCQACQMYDGAIFDVGTPEYREFMPPAKCFGGDRCRGFYVPFSRQMAVAA